LDPDLERINQEIEGLKSAASANKVGAVFGTLIRNDEGLPSNSPLVLSGRGEQVDRYDKRFITRDEVGTHAPGDHPTVFTVGDVRCGIVICYEKWFPELFRDYARRGVNLDIRLDSQSERDLSPAVGKTLIGDADRALWIAYARINHTWISVSNHCRPDQDNTSFLVDPDGRLQMLPFKEQSVRTFTIDLSTECWDPSGPFRDVALAGEMRVPDDQGENA
jgi:predicted amidohydrolase